ncbi:hypothetical protein V6N12_025752 [Hibiscus sabdariffa]|uniref:Uncharacterized protein n=1 Tax=Hibiscus sabdariffa TaxID=183260 RepID=A0ABR2AWR1_9ROSI
MEGSQTSAEYEGCDSDTLELEGDSCINTAIKEHALLGKLKDLKQVFKTIGEGSKIVENELQVRHDSPKSSELTRQSDLAKGCQILEPLQKSDIILGSSKDPVYQGILAEWSPKTRTVYQIKTNSLVLSGGQSLWNRSLALSNQFVNDPTVNKGKQILESSEGEEKESG